MSALDMESAGVGERRPTYFWNANTYSSGGILTIFNPDTASTTPRRLRKSRETNTGPHWQSFMTSEGASFALFGLPPAGQGAPIQGLRSNQHRIFRAKRAKSSFGALTSKAMPGCELPARALQARGRGAIS